MESPPGELRHRGPVPRIAPSGERAAAAPLELKELNKLAMRSPSQGARLRPFHSSSRLSCGRRAVEANHHNSKAKAMVIMMAMTT